MSSPVSPRAPFQEPMNPVKSRWERAGLTKDEYDSYLVRLKIRMDEWRNKRIRAFIEADAKSTDFWNFRMNILEMQRRKYMSRCGWTLEDLYKVTKIDEAIKECEEQIHDIIACQHDLSDEELEN